MENHITPMMEGIVAQFTLQTRLFVNVLKDVTDEQAHERMSEQTNHLAWIAGHTVSSRYSVVNGMGGNDPEPFPELFADRKGIVVDAEYPSLAEQVQHWNHISPTFISMIQGIPTEALLADGPTPVPTGKRLIDFLAFLAHHEAYSIGQMGIIRKYVNLPAMAY